MQRRGISRIRIDPTTARPSGQKRGRRAPDGNWRIAPSRCANTPARSGGVNLYTRLAFAMLGASVLLTAADTTVAQEKYPARIIRIVTAAPGSNHDWGARLTAQELAPRIGQKVIVKNKGSIATEYVAKDVPPNGYTLLFYGAFGLAATVPGEGQLGPDRRPRADHARDNFSQRPRRAPFSPGKDGKGDDRSCPVSAGTAELRRGRRRIDAAHCGRALQVHGTRGHRARPLQGDGSFDDRSLDRGSAAHVQRARPALSPTSSRAGCGPWR